MRDSFNKIGETLKKQAGKDIDRIFGINYKIWVVNSKSEAFLYLWDNWKMLYPEINNLVTLATGQAYIRTFQSFEFEHKWLGFGRMSWTEKNNKKWTSKYRTAEFKEKNLQFFGTEIWSPDWNFCFQTGETPEIYVQVYHHSNSENVREGIVIAMPKRTMEKNEELIITSIKTIQNSIFDSELSSIERYWTPGKGFLNRIEDMNPQELEKIVIGK